MMDLTEKGSGSQEAKKTCVDCQTTKTPLWRGGPAGPKSLCNACGIKYRKRRRALAAMNKSGSHQQPQSQSQSLSEEDVRMKIEDQSQSHRSYIKDNKENNSKMDVSLKLRLLTLGRQVLLRRSSLEKQRKLGEEEQAAVLLMALSCGSVYS